MPPCLALSIKDWIVGKSLHHTCVLYIKLHLAKKTGDRLLVCGPLKVVSILRVTGFVVGDTHSPL